MNKFVRSIGIWTMIGLAAVTGACKGGKVPANGEREYLIFERSEKTPSHIVLGLGTAEMGPGGLSMARTAARLELFRDLALQKAAFVDALLQAHQARSNDAAFDAHRQTIEIALSDVVQRTNFTREVIRGNRLYLEALVDLKEVATALQTTGMTKSIRESEEVIRTAIGEMDERLRARGLSR